MNEVLDEIQKNRKRTETVIKRAKSSIAIARNIEITQTRPTNAVLHALLEQKINDESVRMEQKTSEKEPEI